MNPTNLITPAALRLPPEVVFGAGSSSKTGEYARRLGVGRVLLLSDQGLEEAGVVDGVNLELQKAGLQVDVFTGIQPEPSIDDLQTAVNCSRHGEFKVVIGLGGGSVMDTAKAVALMLEDECQVEEYLGIDLVKHRGLPTILIPTTSGTGAEVTPNALFYIPSRRTKQAIVSPMIVPDVAIIDPLLTLSAPPGVTAATGMDALCHAIEAYTGLNSTPFSDLFASRAIQLISANLRQAVFDGQDRLARLGMALGSLYAGIAIATAGTNGVHALAYPLQGMNRIAHGIANAVLLPYVMHFNLPGKLNRFAEIAALMGQPTGHLSPREAAASGVRLCRELANDIGIPSRLSQLGVTVGQIEAMVPAALAVGRLLANNPRPMKDKNIQEIYREAWEGQS